VKLEALLSPVPVDVFLDRYFGQEFLHIPGAAGKLSRLSPAGGLSGQIPVALRRIAAELERALEAPIRVSLHSVSAGAPMHRPELDGFVLQIGGDSSCTIQREKAGDVPAWSGVLREGDVLYVPRDWRLEAAAGGLLACLDIENPTGADFLSWVLDLAKRHKIIRADIPRFACPAEKSDYVKEVRHTLVRLLRSPSLLEAFRRETNFSAVPEPACCVPWSDPAPENSRVVLLAPRKLRVKRADEETIVLLGMGKRLRFPLDAAPLLHYLSDRAPVRIGDFYGAFEAEFDRLDLAGLLSTLGKEGIIGLEESD
jgi:hypothetical protein